MPEALYCKQGGTGAPILWLHGYLETGRMWDVFPFQEFEERKHFFVDLPGHGLSSAIKPAQSISGIAAQIWDWYDQLNEADPDLVGHSLGGYILLEMHRQRPSNRKLCLFHSNFWPDDEVKKADRNRVIEVVKSHKQHYLNEAIPNLFLNPEKHLAFIEENLKQAAEMPAEAIAAYAAAMRDRKGFEQELQSLKAQMLVIQGARDRIVHLQKMIAYHKDIQLSVLEHAGHMGHVEDQEDAWALLTHWLNIISN